MTNEQGLVERLQRRAELCEAYSEPSETSAWKIEAAATLRQAAVDQLQAADALEAQSAQIAELQAEVERLREEVRRTREFLTDAQHRAGERLGEIADLKRALDTARHDAMEEAKSIAKERVFDDHALAQATEHGLGAHAAALEIVNAISALSASPLSQGGQE